jgi:hypothetical protein
MPPIQTALKHSLFPVSEMSETVRLDNLTDQRGSEVRQLLAHEKALASAPSLPGIVASIPSVAPVALAPLLPPPSRLSSWLTSTTMSAGAAILALLGNAVLAVHVMRTHTSVRVESTISRPAVNPEPPIVVEPVTPQSLYMISVTAKVPGLPVMIDDKEIGKLNAQGQGVFPYLGMPGEHVSIRINTSGNARAKGTKLSQTITLPDSQRAINFDSDVALVIPKKPTPPPAAADPLSSFLR